jgi:uncharacterized protein (TIGR03437 family)
MLKRVFALFFLGLTLEVAALYAQGDLFVLPGTGANSGQVQALVTNPLSSYSVFTAGTGSFAALGALNAAKFYVIAGSTSDTIIATDSTLLSSTVVASLSSPATQGIVTPDGSLLAVAAGTLHLFNTTTDTELVPGGISQGNGINTFGVASSLDASTVIAIGSNSTAGTSQLTAISTATRNVAATVGFSQLATAISVGPNGLLYVSLPDEILELDPRTLNTTYGGTMSAGGTPGPLVFTPDGQYALAVNQSGLGNSLFVVTLATHAVTAPTLGLPQLTAVQVTGVDSVIALSSQGLYEVTISNPLAVSQWPVSGFAVGDTSAIAVSNDVPSATHATVQAAYLASGTNLYQLNPESNTVESRAVVATNVIPGALSYVPPALPEAQLSPASLLAYGTNQTIAPSASSEPLVVQVLSSTNQPISGVTVQFQTGSSGAALSSASATTGTTGYALTYVTAPAATGPIIVTAMVGSLTADFTVQVSSSANATTPQLTIVAGQGQLLLSNSSTLGGLGYGSPLQVLVTNASGSPMASVPVTFSIPPSEGTLVVDNSGALTQVVSTNSAGIASVDFQTTGIPGDNSKAFIQTVVTVSAPNTNQVTFYLTTVNGSPSPYVYLVAPATGVTLTGPAGGTLPDAVSAKVLSSSGAPIPNVSLVLNDGNLSPSTNPTVSCSGGLVLTGPNGIANCNVVFGPRIGTGTFTAAIGFTRTSDPVPFTVTVGAAAVVQITQGNNQVGIPGQTLPLALLVHVTDSGGNAVTDTPVNWQVLTAGAVTLSNVSAATDNAGNASATATLGNIGGLAQVQVTAGAVSATFNLTVNIPTAGIQKISGDKQTTDTGTAFPLPLTVQVVNAGGTGLPGQTVNFQVTSGTATLGTATATTGPTGQASTTVTAGATAGTITVSATSGSFSATFTLTAQIPGPTISGVVNGADFEKGTGISPGGIAIISGTGFLPGVTGLVTPDNSTGQLPTTLAGLTVTFGPTAIPAPIYYVLSGNGTDEATVQVPFEVSPGGTVDLTLTLAGGQSTTKRVPVKPFAPGIFTTVINGKTYPVALRSDGSAVSPTNPAQLGENITVYVTGLGQVAPAAATGEAGVPGQSVVAPLIIGLNNGGVPLISAQYVPGSVGVYVIMFQVPADTKTGPYQPLGIVVFDASGKAYYANSTYLPIQ